MPAKTKAKPFHIFQVIINLQVIASFISEYGKLLGVPAGTSLKKNLALF